MSDSDSDRLGMGRPIDRRDFLNGIAVGVVGGCAAAMSPALAAAGQAPRSNAAAPTPGSASYPPSLTGLRGNYPASIEEFEPLRRGTFLKPAPAEADTDEDYDLVIVGGGISGLSAAYFWHRALPNQRVLILDNHDDFGGHAKRNEFTYGDRTFIGYGGTMGIATPYPYSYTAKSLIVDLGVQVERNAEFFERSLFDTYHLGPATFFDKEHFGEDRLIPRSRDWAEFFAKAPLSAAARADLIRLHGKNPDYMPGLTRGTEDRQARAHQLSGVSAQHRQDQPGGVAVLSRAGRPQQQTGRYHASAGSGRSRPARIRRSRSEAWRGVSRRLLYFPFSGRQRLDRAAAGQIAWCRPPFPAS